MDYLWQVHFQFSWMGLLALMIQLSLLYFILHLAWKGALRITAPSPWQLRLKKIIHFVLLIFEPAVLLLLFSSFVMIHPFYHGLVLLLLTVTNFRHLRNYFSSRIILFDPLIHVGSRLKTGQTKGIISKIGRMRIQVQTDNGLHFITYNNLLQQTYSLLDREEKGGFYRLKIGATPDDTSTESQKQLLHLLNTAPYINWNHPLDIKQIENSAQQHWLAHLSLYQEQHLFDLMTLLEERGFSSQIAKL